MAQRWTARDIGDLSGSTAVVTGANSGIGLAVATELARAGARVVMACRDSGRAATALDSVRAEAPAADVAVLQVDLADLASVRTFAAEFTAAYGDLDLLINNAGVMALPYRKTADGFEMQFGTNHLGHFALTGLLLPNLRRRPAPRVVTVSSDAHKMGKIDFDDLHSERRYRSWPAYGRSKLANLMFAYELQRRADAAGLPLRSLAAHPGYVATNLALVGPELTGNRLARTLVATGNRLLAQSPQAGARTILYAAAAADVPGGSYIAPNGLLEMRGYPRLAGSSGPSKDAAAAHRLWEASEELTGIRYDFAAATT